MPRQPCPQTEDGIHVVLNDGVTASVASGSWDVVSVRATCTACGAIGTTEFELDSLFWGEAPPSLAAALLGDPDPDIN